MNHDHDDFETEPIPGLPKKLPEGEKILWQGAPDRKSIMFGTFHVRKFILYAAIMVVWRGATVIYDGGTLMEGIIAAAVLGVVCGFTISVLAFLAHLVATGTIYTITTKRLVMRFGIALPMTVQIPFRLIASAAVKLNKDGTGSIPLTLNENSRLSYIVMWPHVRPWRLLRPQPMLRALPDARVAAEVLAEALKNALAQEDQDEVSNTIRTNQAAARVGSKPTNAPDEDARADWVAAAG